MKEIPAMTRIRVALAVAVALASLISAACSSPCHIEFRRDSAGHYYPYLNCNWHF